MEVKTQTSFIPKKNFVPGPSLQSVRHTSLLTLISACIFMLSVALAIGVFGYNIYLGNRITSYKKDLTDAIAKLDPATVNELSRTDERIQAATALLANHVDPSNILNFLGTVTLQNVRFSDFDYTATDNQKITLTMDGQADSFSDVALQANEFALSENQKYFHNPTFGNLALDPSGNVTFQFTTDVDPKAFVYKPEALSADMSSASSTLFGTSTTN